MRRAVFVGVLLVVAVASPAMATEPGCEASGESALILHSDVGSNFASEDFGSPGEGFLVGWWSVYVVSGTNPTALVLDLKDEPGGASIAFYRANGLAVGAMAVFPGPLTLDSDDVLRVSIVGGDATTDLRHQFSGTLPGSVGICVAGGISLIEFGLAVLVFLASVHVVGSWAR
jgi:hypothetical protein